MNEEISAIALVVRQILLWEWYDYSTGNKEIVKTIYRDLVRKQVRVSPNMAKKFAIHSDIQGRQMYFPKGWLRKLEGAELSEFAEHRKLQAELCN